MGEHEVPFVCTVVFHKAAGHNDEMTEHAEGERSFDIGCENARPADRADHCAFAVQSCTKCEMAGGMQDKNGDGPCQPHGEQRDADGR